MTNDDYIKRMQKFHEELRADPVRLNAFMRKIMGPERRRLEGQEAKNVELMCALVEPTETSNNQRTITDVYHINQKEYHITYGLEDKLIVEEILPDEV